MCRVGCPPGSNKYPNDLIYKHCGRKPLVDNFLDHLFSFRWSKNYSHFSGRIKHFKQMERFF